MAADVQATIGLNDNMSPVLKRIASLLNIAINDFERLKSASERPISLSGTNDISTNLAQVSAQIEEIENNTRAAVSEQERFKSEVQKTTTEADNLGTKISGYVKSLLGFAAAKKGYSWLKESLSLADTKNQAQVQLEVVLSNVGAAEGTLDKLKQKAQELQNTSMFSESAMFGGASELATYISDSEALERMMDTLADYATGMSGGASVDKRQMIEYATQLGKVFVGAYDGITRKGFELTEVQKEILENGTDMEKAATISEVIEQSWSNLAETMRNTPIGQLTALKNSWTNIREELGNKLYPAVINLFNSFMSNIPQVKILINGLSTALNVVINTLALVFKLAMSIFSFFKTNWSYISPLVYGIVIPLTIFKTTMLAIKAATVITTAVTTAYTTVTGILSIAIGVLAGSTQAATAATLQFNSALLASPITWLVGIIIGVIAAFYGLIAVINKVTGSTLSATGIIMGTIYSLGAFIYNRFIMPVWNGIAMLVNFFANVWHSPIASIKILFYELAQSVIGRVLSMAKTIESIINRIPGVNIDISSGLDSVYSEIGNKIQEIKDESQWKEVVGKLDSWSYSDAYNSGYELGEGLANRVKGLFNGEEVASNILTPNFNNDTMEESLANIDSNTSNISDSIAISEEDLKYLRDIAQRDAVNRFTTAEITIEQTNNNQIASELDLDGIMDRWNESFTEILEVAAEGVH